MKKLTITILAVLLIGSMAWAQNTTVIYAGGTWDHPEGAFGSSVGGGFKAGPVWLFAQGKFADPSAALEGEIIIFKKLGGNFIGGLVASPFAGDWIGVEGESMAPISYLTGACGALLGYHKDKAGIYLGGKYKYAYDSEVAYKNGWRVGVWLAFNP